MADEKETPEQQTVEPLPTAPGSVIPTLADLTYIEKSAGSPG